ncbi:MAG: hypothetical protein K6T90_07645 [Leptolyngbyaceae cyanobacterium HOT.MB2.61]|nr:hypothetical protein [Leptolyngbyaceae cyanobacterium HOT.MB2.61]
MVLSIAQKFNNNAVTDGSKKTTEVNWNGGLSYGSNDSSDSSHLFEMKL